MRTITMWNVFFVLVASLVFTISIGGIGPSRAFACDYGCDHDYDCGCECDHGEGWMTGGGSIFASNGNDCEYGGQGNFEGRVTHGFVVHCTPRHSDNLQVVDHSTGQSFHLTELTYAICSDNPRIRPNPPDAGFDTFEGWGIGRCKKPARDCEVYFLFTDGGERGGCVRDTALICVTDENGVVFAIAGNVDCGNHQAHDGF